jgi:hypothetical protein
MYLTELEIKYTTKCFTFVLYLYSSLKLDIDCILTPDVKWSYIYKDMQIVKMANNILVNDKEILILLKDDRIFTQIIISQIH